MVLNFISFSERSFHSLITANMKLITAVVPEIIDLEYAWGSRSGTRQSNFTIGVIKLYQETGQKCYVFLLKRTIPQNKKLHMHLINFKHTQNDFLQVSVSFTYIQQLKRSNRNVSKIYS